MPESTSGATSPPRGSLKAAPKSGPVLHRSADHSVYLRLRAELLRRVECKALRDALRRFVPVLRRVVLRAVDLRAVDLRALALRAVDLRPDDRRVVLRDEVLRAVVLRPPVLRFRALALRPDVLRLDDPVLPERSRRFVRA
jgi:hypothetical protein